MVYDQNGDKPKGRQTKTATYIAVCKYINSQCTANSYMVGLLLIANKYIHKCLIPYVNILYKKYRVCNISLKHSSSG